MGLSALHKNDLMNCIVYVWFLVIEMLIQIDDKPVCEMKK